MRLLAALLVAGLLAGCGGGSGGATSATSALGPEPPSATTRPNAPTPAPPSTPPVSPARYTAALDAYCATTVGAVRRLSQTKEDVRDPVHPIATFARRFRAGLERLGRVSPPAALRQFHLLTLAEGRESADRLDDGVRLGRQGDTDAATTALQTISGLIPTDLPLEVERGAPACARGIG